MVETIYNIPNIPSLALLSDLHARPYEAVVSSLRRHRLDLICITGDFIFGAWPEDDASPLDTQKNVLPFLRFCASITPTFVSLGNHEWMLDEEDLETIQSTGAVLLDNDFTTIQIAGKEVVLGGLTSAYVTKHRALAAHTIDGRRYPRREQIITEHIPETEWLEKYSSASGLKILLSHHPEYFPMIPKEVDLVLSGHAHGGQWAYYSFRRKRMCGVWSPGQGLLPKWTKGVYEGGRLVVSAGLSNTSWVPRIFNSTEVVIIN